MRKRTLLVFLLTMCLTISTFSPCAFAGQKQTDNYLATSQTPIESSFSLIVDNGNLYIKENTVTTRMGGGIGHCPADGKKTFTKTFTRDQAKAALNAETLGEGSVKAIGSLLGSYLDVVGLTSGVVLSFIGGDSTLVRYLKNFLDTNKKEAKFVFKTHCVDRGYMYGDPMYDYEVDSIKITY